MSKPSADEDDMLLSQLTEAELAELNEIFDPDNSLLPASERMPVQTQKKTTGPFDRNKLLTHLKKQAKESKIGEDYVPYVPKPKPDEGSKAEQQSKKKGIISTEFDDILEGLDESDIAELASELGLHSLINQAQSRGDENAPMAAKASPMPKFELALELPKESDIIEAITLLEDNDSSFTEVNLNNHPLIQPEHLDQIMAALKINTYVENVSLANVRMVDKHAAVLADVIRENDVIKTLNVESNRLSVQGVRSIVSALKSNTTIREVRISNQLARFGHRTEDEIAKMLEHNTTILKFGFSFQSNGPRFEVQRHLMRNVEKERQRRQQLAD